MTCPTPGQCGCWAEAAEQGDTDAYIEAVTHTWAAPPLPTRLHESPGSLYSPPIGDCDATARAEVAAQTGGIPLRRWAARFRRVAGDQIAVRPPSAAMTAPVM